ncbi:hypothetical protein [uncultured Marivita sp.]|uniref:hypothetical protein n=1 Tax=uncultured Marivita sp. TaxID=888080 RepID=UPI002610D64A|nr:hypothetical protein [uncultured Marivita sp.]
MVDRLNWLAWLVAAAAILAWAFMPRSAQAGTVIVPKAPTVEVTVLSPPVLLPEEKGLVQPGSQRRTAKGG